MNMNMNRRKMNNNDLTTISIREDYRCQIREKQLRTLFKQTRDKFSQQQNRQKEMQKNGNQIFSHLVFQPYAVPQFDRFVANQQKNNKMNENFQVNVNIGNVNIQNNHQNGAIFRNVLANTSMSIEDKKQQKAFCENRQVRPLAFFPNIINNQRAPHINTFKVNDNNNGHFAQLRRDKKILVRHKNYLVYDKLLGTGSYSKVYLGLDTISKKQVAIKEVAQLDNNQIKVLKSIQSPYVVKLEACWHDEANRLTYIVLQLCENNLRQQIKDKKANDSQKLKYFQNVVYGIDALFSKKIIHRDLKFENILVSKDKIAKLTDFGLAKNMGIFSNIASLRCGTPYTMAPQIFFHNGYGKPYYSQKCDIWSLGVILHQILYKIHPFNYNSERLIKMQRVYVQKKFGYLDLIIDKTLVKDPVQRIDWKQFKQIFYAKGYQNRVKQIEIENIGAICSNKQHKSKKKDEKNQNYEPIRIPQAAIAKQKKEQKLMQIHKPWLKQKANSEIEMIDQKQQRQQANQISQFHMDNRIIVYRNINQPKFEPIIQIPKIKRRNRFEHNISADIIDNLDRKNNVKTKNIRDNGKRPIYNPDMMRIERDLKDMRQNRQQQRKKVQKIHLMPAGNIVLQNKIRQKAGDNKLKAKKESVCILWFFFFAVLLGMLGIFVSKLS